MAAPYVIDPTSPADAMVVSQFPANERSLRATLKEWIEIDHSATTGNHKQVTLDDPGSEPTYASAKLGLYQRSGVLKSKLASGTARQIPQFTTGSSGDKALFVQAAAPTGWTQDTSVNDRVLRIVSSTGAGTGGSWTISGLTHAHTHTQQGTFTSGNNSAQTTVDGYDGGSSAQVGSGPHTHNVTISGQTGAASSGAVSSDGTWRPAYVDVIACYMTT